MTTKTKKARTFVRFNVSPEDARLIADIAHRAFAMALRQKIHDTSLYGWQMDITAVHRNIFPLRLSALLSSDDFNFSHDVFGIRRHLDREAGTLGGCFVPRFTEMVR